MNGALDQSVLTRPPLVAQSSAFHKLAYNLIGLFFGNKTPIDSEFLNSLIGVSSTVNLIYIKKEQNRLGMSKKIKNLIRVYLLV